MEKQGTNTEGRIAAGIPIWAQQLDLSPGFLRLEVSRGRLQVTRLGRRVLITKREIERYLAANESLQADADEHLSRR
jgi:excisionase family DNA binding protein